jgi:hypothetical protein
MHRENIDERLGVSEGGAWFAFKRSSKFENGISDRLMRVEMNNDSFLLVRNN